MPDDGSVVPIADPLTVFLENHRRALPAHRRGGKRYNAGEHAWLAAHGARQARERLSKQHGIDVEDDTFTAIRRRVGREELDYGELVALSGDFYDSPSAMFDETPSPLPWLYEANDLSDLREIFAEELRWIDERRTNRGGDTYPDTNVRLAWNAKSYVELALQNTDHFGWHNICAYMRHHAEAMRLAASTRGRSDETFRRAIYTQAFADHFLTDAFAAGHMRVPRAEIREWAQQQDLGERVAGALSKLLHDQDGHVDLRSVHGVVDEEKRGQDDGLHVIDSTGTSWRTRCDGQLFLEVGASQSVAVERAVSAVAASVLEFLLAWKRRQLPSGVYAATSLVPFPHPSAPTLIEKFPVDASELEVDALWAGVQWYAKIPWIAGMRRSHIRDLFAALPTLMGRFRTHVAEHAARDPELGKRLPASYVAAFKSIS